MDATAERAVVVAEARAWIGTPFHHAARIKGVGVDCAQFLIGVYAGAGVVDVPEIRAYSRDWFLHEDVPHYLEELERFAAPLPDGATPDIGDIATFRYGRAVSHAGILVDADVMVHAFRDLGVILEAIGPNDAMSVRLAGYWRLTRWAA